MEWRAVGVAPCPPFPGGRPQADLTAAPCGDPVREVDARAVAVEAKAHERLIRQRCQAVEARLPAACGEGACGLGRQCRHAIEAEVTAVPGERQDHLFFRIFQAVEGEQPIVGGKSLGRGDVDRSQAVHMECARVPRQGQAGVGRERLQSVEPQVVGVRGQFGRGRVGELRENGEVEEAPTGRKLTGRCGVERAEATEGDPERIGRQTVGLGGGEAFRVMVGRATEEAILKHAERPRSLPAVFGG